MNLKAANVRDKRFGFKQKPNQKQTETVLALVTPT